MRLLPCALALFAAALPLSGCGEPPPEGSTPDAQALQDSEDPDVPGFLDAVQETSGTPADGGTDATKPAATGCQTDAECLVYEDGNACNGTFFCDKALSPPTCRISPATVVQCPTSGDTACQHNTCDPATGTCGMKHAAKGAPCVDDDPCTVDSACEGGKCAAKPGSWCECKATADCAPFEDGDPCTGTLFCDVQSFPYRCKTVPTSVVQCDPAKSTPCAAHACDEKTGKCAMVPVQAGTPCDDGDKATVGDTCKDGACGSGLKIACTKDSDCDGLEDGNLCNGTLFCDLGSKECKLNPATVIVCPTGADSGCVKSQCNPATGVCALQPVKNGTACDDGDKCSDEDLCLGGKCTAGAKFVCQCQDDAECNKKHDDGNLCNGLYYCHKNDKKCVLKANEKVVCPTVNDTACNKSACGLATGKCQMTPVRQTNLVCDLPDEKCRRETKPVGAPLAASVTCDDGDACTVGDLCEGASCKPGKKACPCKIDSDCLTQDDGDLCNGVPLCLPGPSGGLECSAKSYAPVFCDKKDDTDCRKNTCDKASGKCALVDVADATACDDGKLCTVDSACEKGVCGGGKLNPCADGKACTQDTCEPGKGCVHPPLCSDGNECTVDACEAGTGKCSYPSKPLEGTSCSGDGNGCTVNDRCKAGACVVGPAVVCSQPGAVCQDVACVSTSAGSFQCVTALAKDGAACDDGQACSVGDTCKGGKCAAGALSKLFVRDLPIKGLDYADLRDVVGLAGGGVVVVGGARNALDTFKASQHRWLLARVDEGGKADVMAKETADKAVHVQASGALVELGGTVLIGGAAKNGASTDLKLVRLSPDLATEAWSMTLGKPTLNEGMVRMRRRPGGGVVLLAVRESPQGARTWLAAVSAGGKQLVDVEVGAVNEQPADLAVQPDGQVAIAGNELAKARLHGANALGALTWTTELYKAGFDQVTALASTTVGFTAAGLWKASGSGTRKLLLAGIGADGAVLHTTQHNLQFRVHQLARNGAQLAAAAHAVVGNDELGRLLGVGAFGDLSWQREVAKTAQIRAIRAHTDGTLAAAGIRYTGAGAMLAVALRADAWGQLSCEDSGGCAAVGAQACDDNNPCTRDFCEAVVGAKGVSKACVHGASSSLCDDGSACTKDDACVGGKCASGQPLKCNDGNDCTLDSCDAKLGCTSQDVGGACTDGDACTKGDACLKGACVATPIQCDDAEHCTVDTCDQLKGCVHLPAEVSAVCGAGDACNQVACISGGKTKETACKKVPLDGNACEDGDLCTIGDACKKGVCAAGNDRYGKRLVGATGKEWALRAWAVDGGAYMSAAKQGKNATLRKMSPWGAELWSRTEASCNLVHAAPAHGGGSLLLCDDGNVVRFDAAGKRLSRHDYGPGPNSESYSRAVAGCASGVVVVGRSYFNGAYYRGPYNGNATQAVKIETGNSSAHVVECTGEGGFVIGTTVDTSSKGPPATTERDVFGNIRWRYVSYSGWRVNKLAVTADRVFAGHSRGASARVIALNRLGNVQWDTPLGKAALGDLIALGSEVLVLTSDGPIMRLFRLNDTAILGQQSVAWADKWSTYGASILPAGGGRLTLVGSAQDDSGTSPKTTKELHVNLSPWGHESCEKAGKCRNYALADCDDDDACTDDGCASGTGCTHAENKAPCDDGSPCTVASSCKDGGCQTGSPRMFETVLGGAKKEWARDIVELGNGDLLALGMTESVPDPLTTNYEVAAYRTTAGGKLIKTDATLMQLPGVKGLSWAYTAEPLPGRRTLLAGARRSADSGKHLPLMAILTADGALERRVSIPAGNAARTRAIEDAGGGYVVQTQNAAQLGQQVPTLWRFDEQLVQRIPANNNVSPSYTIPIEKTLGKWQYAEVMALAVTPRGDVASVGTAWRAGYPSGQTDAFFILNRRSGNGMYVQGPSFVTSDAGSERIEDVALRGDGGFIAVGSNHQANMGSADGWLVSIAPDMQLQQTRSLGSKGLDVLVHVVPHPSGGWLAAGWRRDDKDDDGWLVHFDERLQVRWQRTLDRGGAEVLWAARFLANGDIAAVGRTSAQTAGDDDLWLLRLDPWGRQTCTASGKCASVAVPGCVDGDVCTRDECDPKTGCKHTPDTNRCAERGGCPVTKDNKAVLTAQRQQFTAIAGESGAAEQLTGVVADTGAHTAVGWTEAIAGKKRQAWIERSNANGSSLFAHDLGLFGDESFEGVTSAGGGAVVASGWTNDGSLGARGGQDGWLVKIDDEGTVRWARTYGGEDDDSLWAVARWGAGYVAAGRTKTQSTGGWDGWIVATGADGVAKWQFQLGGSKADELRAVATRADGGVIAVGFSKSEFLTVKNRGGFDVWVVTVSPGGKLEKTRGLGDSGDQLAYALVHSNDGLGWLVAGRTSTYGFGDAALYRMKDDLSAVWSLPKTYGGKSLADAAHSIVAAPWGYLLTGTSASADKGTQGNQGWLLGVDEAGNKRFERSFGDSKDDRLAAVSGAPNGHLVLVGSTSKSLTDSDRWTLRTNAWGYADCAKAGKCGHTGPLLCDDGRDCTADSCEPQKGCVHAAIPGATCKELGEKTNTQYGCAHLLAKQPSAVSGTYWIAPGGGGEKTLRWACDMQTDGGGWTLVAALPADAASSLNITDGDKDKEALHTQADGAVTIAAWAEAYTWGRFMLYSGKWEALIETGTGLYKVVFKPNVPTLRAWMRLNSNSKADHIKALYRADVHSRPHAGPITWTELGTSAVKKCDIVSGVNSCPYAPWRADSPWAQVQRPDGLPAAGYDGVIPHFSRIWIR